MSELPCRRAFPTSSAALRKRPERRPTVGLLQMPELLCRQAFPTSSVALWKRPERRPLVGLVQMPELPCRRAFPTSWVPLRKRLERRPSCPLRAGRAERRLEHHRLSGEQQTMTAGQLARWRIAWAAKSRAALERSPWLEPESRLLDTFEAGECAAGAFLCRYFYCWRWRWPWCLVGNPRPRALVRRWPSIRTPIAGLPRGPMPGSEAVESAMPCYSRV
jgi:hypothetical protein